MTALLLLPVRIGIFFAYLRTMNLKGKKIAFTFTALLSIAGLWSSLASANPQGGLEYPEQSSATRASELQLLQKELRHNLSILDEQYEKGSLSRSRYLEDRSFFIADYINRRADLLGLLPSSDDHPLADKDPLELQDPHELPKKQNHGLKKGQRYQVAPNVYRIDF